MSVTEIILPKLGLTMAEGKVLAWRKREGDAVAPGEILFEVETDKAAMEVEAPAAGFLRRILVAEGESVPVATVIALITTTADEPLPAATEAGRHEETGRGRPVGSAGPRPPATEPARPLGPAGETRASRTAAAPSPASRAQWALTDEPARSPSADRRTASPATERVIASPAAKRRAGELGVELASVVGSGPGGRIQIEDVEKAAAAGPATTSTGDGRGPITAAGAGERREPLSRMRKAIAERMTRSVREAPQFSISRDVDMSAADALRRREDVSYTDVILAACAKTLAAHPRLRSRLEGDALVTGDGIHLGHAVAVDAGLLVPVLRDVDRKTLGELRSAREAVERGARDGRLPADALSGGVFSVSNLGTLGVDLFTAIVNPPEAAILALGRVADRVVARDGAAEIRPMVTLTLSVDHRVADGAEAARFLSDLAERLERAEL